MSLPRFLLLALLLAANVSASAEIHIQPRIINGVESDPQAWSFMTALMNRTLGITVGDNSYPATYLIGSPARLFSGTLVDCGLASEPCAQARGNICLILRGNNTFAEKVSNCEQGGGIGAIIYNHSPGTFLGTLQRAVTSIPSVSVSGEVGQSLLAAVGEFASFGYTNEIPTESFCGATWLGQTWVVTAAHCVADVEPVAIMVNVGGHDLRTDQRNVIKVEEILVHTGYDADKIRNDIALLRLTHEPSGVTPVDMATAQQLDTAIAQHQLAKALGRGQQDPVAPEEPAPPTPVTYELYEVDMPLVTNEECAQALGRILNPLTMEPTDLVTDSMVCAGRPEGNIGTCFGDSGGPLLLLDNDTPYLAGITSWGIGCGEPGLYDVFTRVPSYRQEIEQTISVASTTKETGANGFGDSEADQKADHQSTLERIFGGAVSILLLPTLLLAGLLRRGVK